MAVGQLKLGRLDEARAILEQVVAQTPGHLTARHFLGLALFQSGDRAKGLGLLRATADAAPDNPVFAQNLGGALYMAGRHDEAVPWLERVVAAQPGNAMARGALAVALYHAGEVDTAVAHGQRALEILDCESLAAHDGTTPGAISVPPFDRTRPERNVVAFSLWGTTAAYLDGAVENAVAARFIYPEWRCRFYCDDSVPADLRDRLRREGVDIMMRPRETITARGLFWRFEVANDRNIDRFLVRDADSVLSVRERLAVEDWIVSGRPFHLMRDHVTQIELILAGMWGGVAGILPDMRRAALDVTATDRARLADQRFLRRRIWPLIRGLALTHDPHYRVAETRPFPPLSDLPPPQHVGRAAAKARHRTEFF